MSAKYVVELENVTKRYAQGSLEVMALRGLTLRIQSGEFTTLVGPSGSGKTTALNLIGALDHPSSGSIRLEGQDLSELG
ncbi:MAG: ATP-binding cassette domain-containing protein, partial [Myxococcota bacterium]